MESNKSLKTNKNRINHYVEIEIQMHPKIIPD